MRYLLLLSCLVVHNIQSMIVLPEDKTKWFRLFNSTEKQVLFEKIKWHKTEKLFDTDFPCSASKQVILTDLEAPHKIITIDGLLRRPPALHVARKSNPNNNNEDTLVEIDGDEMSVFQGKRVTNYHLAKFFEPKENGIIIHEGKKFRVSLTGTTFLGKQKIREIREFVQQDAWFRKKIFYVEQSINPDDHKVTYTLERKYHKLTLLSVTVLTGSAALGLILLIEQLKQQLETYE